MEGKVKHSCKQTAQVVEREKREIRKVAKLIPGKKRKKEKDKEKKSVYIVDGCVT